MKKCKFCHKPVKRPSKGYCVSCYQYFILYSCISWVPSNYGELNRVDIKEDKQYEWPICHICGKAFTKLQQHIWYAHNLTKNEYCDLFGLDRSINMTSPVYNKKMHDYAIKYNMDKQLEETGRNTRFKSGHDHTYKRSYQTMKRLKQNNFRKFKNFS